MELPPSERCIRHKPVLVSSDCCNHGPLDSENDDELTPRPADADSYCGVSGRVSTSLTAADVHANDSLIAIQSLTVDDTTSSPRTHRRSKSSPQCRAYTETIEVIESNI